MANILIVDDEQTILSILTTLLRMEGHEITPALGGKVAMKLLEENEAAYDLMISDIRMPEVDGMKLLEYVHENYPEMIVIMLTAYGQVETAIRAMELGAFDYIKKPFKADHLTSTVEKALECSQFMGD
jgi:DNA-binding NtrC family response regulator